MEPGILVDGERSTSIVLRPGGGTLRHLLRTLAGCAGQAVAAPLLLLPVWLIAAILFWVLDPPGWTWLVLAGCYLVLAAGAFALLMSAARTIYRLEVADDSVRVVRLGGSRAVARQAVRQVVITDHRVHPYEGDPSPEASTHVEIGVELADGSAGSRSVEGADADALAHRIRQLLPGVTLYQRTERRQRAKPLPHDPLA